MAAIGEKLQEMAREAHDAEQEYKQLKTVVDTGNLGMNGLVATAAQKTAARAGMEAIEARINAGCSLLGKELEEAEE